MTGWGLAYLKTLTVMIDIDRFELLGLYIRHAVIVNFDFLDCKLPALPSLRFEPEVAL